MRKWVISRNVISPIGRGGVPDVRCLDDHHIFSDEGKKNNLKVVSEQVTDKAISRVIQYTDRRVCMVCGLLEEVVCEETQFTLLVENPYGFEFNYKKFYGDGVDGKSD